MSAQPVDESIITLSEEARTDLSAIIYEYVLGEVPRPEFLDALIEREPELMLDGIKWTFGDTVVREQVASSVSKWLVDCRWPMYGDKWTDERFDKFIKDIQQSYRDFVSTLPKAE